MNQAERNLLAYLEEGLRVGKPKRRPPLRVEVTRSPVGYGDFVASFIRNGIATSYSLSARRYDRLVQLANSGAYRVEILDSDWGIAWQMRRK